MSSILRKAKNYKRIAYKALGGPAHERDPYSPPPQILRPNKPR